MDDALVMRVVQGRSERGADGTNLAVRERRGRPDTVLEVAAFHQLHDDVRRPSVFSDVVDGDDIRMAQPGGSTCFAPESFEKLGVARKLRVQQFDRHRTVQQRVFGAPHRGHAASGDFAQQSIAPAQDALGIGHKRVTSSSGSTVRSPWRRRISRRAWACTRLTNAGATSRYTGKNTTAAKATINTSTSNKTV